MTSKPWRRPKRYAEFLVLKERFHWMDDDGFFHCACIGDVIVMDFHLATPGGWNGKGWTNDGTLRFRSRKVDGEFVKGPTRVVFTPGSHLAENW